ncbi:MAG: HDOD domain-containing protein [Pseudomonadota bacterium]
MAEIVKQIEEDLKTALADDQLDMPSLPEVALKIREEAESENVSAITLGRVVSEDPALAAQLVRTANSPAFRATRSIDDVSQAISRMGVEYAANIVTGLAMQHMFQATSELVDKKMREVWRASCEIAALSSILCSRYTRLRPDQATLAGLTHCIGVLPILSWVEEYDHVIQDGMTLNKVINAVHPSLGEQILTHWKFAEDITLVPNKYLLLNRRVEHTDYADLVCAAHLLRRCGFTKDPDALENFDASNMPEGWQDAQPFIRLDFDFDMPADDREQIFEEFQAGNSGFS